MPSIAKRIAAELSENERIALKLHGLGRADRDLTPTEALRTLRLVSEPDLRGKRQLTAMGKDVLGEAILLDQSVR